MSNQGLRQASVRAITGTTSTYEGDWHALFDASAIPVGTFNGRLLAWINQELGAEYTELNGAMYAFAQSLGAASWNELGSFLDPDAADYISRVQAADGALMEVGVKRAFNKFVIKQKNTPSPNVSVMQWEALKSAVPMIGAHSLAGALVPLRGDAPTNFNFVAGDYDRTMGLKGNGVDKYLNANRNNNADPKNNKHLAVYISESGSLTDLRSLIGFGTGSGSSQLLTLKSSNLLYVRLNYTGSSTVVIPVPLTGLVGASRMTATNVDYYYQGTAGSRDSNSVTPLNGDITVFANAGGSNCDDRLYFYSIGEAVDLEELAADVEILNQEIQAALS